MKKVSIVVLVVFVVYIIVFAFHSRFGAQSRMRNGVTEYCFSLNPDWAHFYYWTYRPLISVDQILFDRRHVYFVDYV
jgi:hypothetical protein